MNENNMLKKREYISRLCEVYGSLLTPRQTEAIELFYGDDLSLSEIAENFSTSKQAVYDLLKRTEAILENYEDKLRLLDAAVQRKESLEQMDKLLLQLMQSQESSENSENSKNKVLWRQFRHELKKIRP